MKPIESIARDFVLYWHQGHGTLQRRIDSLNDAVKAARLKATFIQSDNAAGWTGRDAAIAKEFRRHVERACIQGYIEREIADVKSIIMSYRAIPLWKRLLRWLRTDPV